MTNPVIFEDVEMALTTYLRAALADYGYPGIYVGNRRGTKDNPEPSPAVTVRRDGGPVLDQVREAARVGVNVYSAGATDENVAALAATVSALLRAAADGDPVVRVTQTSGPSPIPDATTTPRRFMTFEVVTRGSDLTETP